MTKEIRNQKPIVYFDKETPVLLGDHVQTKIWLRTRYGRVVYIPGISQPNQAMEDEGLIYVGVQIENGPFVATLVDPDGYFLKKKIVLLKRDAVNVTELDPNIDPFAEDS